jgi:hypothetical protein
LAAALAGGEDAGGGAAARGRARSGRRALVIMGGRSGRGGRSGDLNRLKSI